MNSTLKVHTPETRTLIEKIKAEIRKRAEAKARRMLLNQKTDEALNGYSIIRSRSLSCLSVRNNRQSSRCRAV